MNKKQTLKIVEVSGKNPKALSRGMGILSELLSDFFISQQKNEAPPLAKTKKRGTIQKKDSSP